MAGIFISYRRTETAGYATILTDRLPKHFEIFRDFDAIEAGQNFVDAINQALTSCDILIAVIGPQWATLTNNQNTPRIQDPGDYVRLEIATALKRNITVIPLLVNSANWPPDIDLPEDLKALRQIQVHELSEKQNRLDHDMRGLIQRLEILIAASGSTTEILAHYYRSCIQRWLQPRYALDQRFVNLTLLLDQGEQAEGPRWQASSESFEALSDVVDRVPEQAMVLLGAPGSGKSTLLRHFQMQLSQAALDATVGKAPNSAAIVFFIPLSEYKARLPGDPMPIPKDWLAEQWKSRYPGLPDLPVLLAKGGVILLLDALNEIPYSGDEPIRLWKAFLQEINQGPPTNRVIFSCRSLDYSAPLSSRDLPVLQVRIEPLSDTQVEEFVKIYSPEHSKTLWANLQDSPQLDLFRSPYYLKMLVNQSADGEIPNGRAGLFSGFVRQLLKREIETDNPLFQAGELLNQRDIRRLLQAQRWTITAALPDQGILIPKLCDLAYQMQAQRKASEAGQVRIDYQQALDLLDHPQADTILQAGNELGVLDEDPGSDEILYIHQLVQEYFAARKLAGAPQPQWVEQHWQAAEVSPSLEKVLAKLPDSDPLPPLPGSGWEETTLLAAAMTKQANEFVLGLVETNLALAGRCAAQPEVEISDPVKTTLRQKLIHRSQDPKADLRARIAAGLALGEIGDPRFEYCDGAEGSYLLPPMIDIAGGRYSIGSDEGLYERESPVHEVIIESFRLGQFPVTNAEWRLFMMAGGYDTEQWWKPVEAKAWRRGENTAEGPKQQWREDRKYFQDNFEQIREWHRKQRITSKQADDLEQIAKMGDQEFEAQLEKWFPPGRQTQPEYWNDELYSNGAQPVVGICWHEALAYCAWLNAQSGQSFRLPSEAEWEAAARGRKGRRFSYGDNFETGLCNTFESHIRRTTPVGIFQNARNLETLADMTGNVWEWTSSVFKSYPYDTSDGRENTSGENVRRVVRGGSWGGDQGSARAACRNYNHPDNRYNYLGFRVCCSSPII